VLKVVLDKDGMEIRRGSGKEKKIERYELGKAGAEANSIENLVAWLKLDAAAIHKAYRVEGDVKDKTVLICTPKDPKRSPFSTLQMKFHEDGRLLRLSIAEKSGDKIEIQFSKQSFKRK